MKIGMSVSGRVGCCRRLEDHGLALGMCIWVYLYFMRFISCKDKDIKNNVYSYCTLSENNEVKAFHAWVIS